MNEGQKALALHLAIIEGDNFDVPALEKYMVDTVISKRFEGLAPADIVDMGNKLKNELGDPKPFKYPLA